MTRRGWVLFGALSVIWGVPYLLIKIAVTVRTPDGLKLGRSMQLTVRSTALGTIGVVITIVAGCVLALALLVRFTRRMRGRNHPEPKGPDSASPPAPPDGATTEPAGSTAS